jgi:hypothetical protein
MLILDLCTANNGVQFQSKYSLLGHLSTGTEDVGNCLASHCAPDPISSAGWLKGSSSMNHEKLAALNHEAYNVLGLCSARCCCTQYRRCIWADASALQQPASRGSYLP